MQEQRNGGSAVPAPRRGTPILKVESWQPTTANREVRD
jgi:hypothetical protein